MNDSTAPQTNPANYDIPALRAKLLAQLGDDAAAYPANIEREFPRILARLTELWGSEALGPYLDSLTFNERSTRNGFPPDAGAELLRLSNLHKTQHPGPKPAGTGWESLSDDTPA